MGALLVLLLAALEPAIAAVYARLGLVSYASLLQESIFCIPHVPSYLEHGKSGI